MYSNKQKTNWYGFLVTLLIAIAFIFDIIFSTTRLPILTIVVCGIVVLYECISPLIYSSR